MDTNEWPTFVEALDVERARTLLASGADPNAPCFPEATVLHALVALKTQRDEDLARQAEFIAAMLEAGADPNRLNQHRYTPLARIAWRRFSSELKEQFAAEHIVAALIAKGASPNPVLAEGGLLMSAITAGNSNIAKALVQAGADVNVRGGGNRRRRGDTGMITPIEEIIDGGEHVDQRFAEVIKALIRAGADLSMKLTDGSTLLHRACWIDTDRPMTVKLLLKAGLDPNGCDTQGNTPLHRAAVWCNCDEVDTLIAHGAVVDARNHAGRTPLAEQVFTWLTWKMGNRPYETLRRLLAAGADPLARGGDGKTVIDLTASRLEYDREGEASLHEIPPDVKAMLQLHLARRTDKTISCADPASSKPEHAAVPTQRTPSQTEEKPKRAKSHKKSEMVIGGVLVGVFLFASVTAYVTQEPEQVWKLQAELDKLDLESFNALQRLQLLSKEQLSDIESRERDAETRKEQADQIWNSIPVGEVIGRRVNGGYYTVGRNKEVERLRTEAEAFLSQATKLKIALGASCGTNLLRSTSVQVWQQREQTKLELVRVRAGYRWYYESAWGRLVKVLHGIGVVVALLTAIPTGLLVLAFFFGAFSKKQ